MSTQTYEQHVEAPNTDGPRLSHVIGPELGGLGRDGSTLALEARVHGLPLMTLCRMVLVPSRNPRRLPLCPICEARLREHVGAEALDQVPYA